jgi:hypothetical protein
LFGKKPKDPLKEEKTKEEISVSDEKPPAEEKSPVGKAEKSHKKHKVCDPVQRNLTVSTRNTTKKEKKRLKQEVEILYWCFQKRGAQTRASQAAKR